MVKAKDVLSAEMMRYVGRVAVKPSDSAKAYAKARRAQARLEEAKRRFPGLSDWEALDMLREWEQDHR